MSRHRFKDKIALVTGAGTGVGRATACLLAREGAAVALVGRRHEPLEAVANEITNWGGRALPLPADVANEEEITRAVKTAAAELGGLDCLVNAAGVLRLGTVANTTAAEWDETFGINAKGCFLTSRAAIPFLRERKGAIVNVSSVFAYAAGKGAALYAASKAAVVALTRTMALDHIDEGIRINAVAPGSMSTPMLQAVAQASAPKDPDAVLNAVGRMHPIRRLIEADEVASLIAFLLSDEAAAIVGVTYPIDGGRLAKLGSAD